MDFKILGTGSATPQLNRHPSAFLVSIANDLILIDCGESTQHRFLEHKVKIGRLKFILISHLHGDHYFGLIGLLSSMSLSKRTESLTIIGPKGLDEILTTQFKYSQTFLNFQIIFISTDATTSEDIFENELLTIKTIPLSHRIPCCGYLITQKEAKRNIIKDKLPENFPIAYIKQLKEGNDVFDELSGINYSVSEYTLEGDGAKSLAYCSDTAYLESIVPLISKVDLLYHEATFGDELLDRAISTFHSTASQAATIAKSAKVKKLVIGHFSSRYKTLDGHLSEAKAIFDETYLAEEGAIHQL